MDEERHVHDWRVIVSQVIPVLVKCINLIALGMNMAYSAILIPALSSDPMFEIDKEQISWIASINLMPLIVGSCMSGALSQKLGRKRLMHILSIPLFASWFICTFATRLWHILLFLALYGFAQGLCEAAVLSYTAEIAQNNLRGVLSVTNILSMVVGVFIQYALKIFLSWRDVATVSCLAPLLGFILLFFVPESPHWLIMKNKVTQAQKSLAWVRGWTTLEMVEKEFNDICSSHNVHSNTNNEVYDKNNHGYKNFRNILSKYTKQSFYWPLTLLGFVCVFSTFTGAGTMQTYCISIFITFQVPIDVYYSTFILGFVQIAGCVVNIVFLRYAGKRVLSFVSLGGAAVSACGLGVYAYLTNTNYLIFKEIENDQQESNQITWLPFTLILFLSFISFCAIRELPLLLIGEVFSHETRGTGCGLITALFVFLTFLSNKFFLRMIDAITLAGAFYFNCGISIIGLIVLYFALPETEGKSLQDVINHFAGVSKLSNKVKKKNQVNPVNNG